jgi:hypothetical protein
MIGHDFKNCKRWNMDAGLRSHKETHMKQKAPEKKQVYVPTNDGRLQLGKSKEVVNVEKEVINVDECNSPLPQVNVEGNNIEQISASGAHEPAHHANSVNLGYNDNCILRPVSPKELSRLQDEQLEKELNEVSDGSWSTDSQDSFVDTTQPNVQLAVGKATVGDNNNEVVTPDNPIGGEASKIVPIPDRVARDMVFLKESWANMTEADDEAFQNVENTNIDADSNEQGFQLHLTKNKKKAQKKAKRSSRDSYATRSKVPPKPFR